MERMTSHHSSSHVSAGPKVSQIANIFQKRPQEPPPDIPTKDAPLQGSGVVRTESHAARFNHARALFERLGEGKVNISGGFSIRKSNSRDDNLKDIPSPDKSDPPSPRIKYVKISNGVSKIDANKIHNVSRIKIEKPEKPEKPERKFNSRELIEKQKNWTSHFSKSKTNKTLGEFNRCDIIRAPTSGVMSTDVRKVMIASSLEEQDEPIKPEPPVGKPLPPFKNPQISSPTRTTFLSSSPKKSDLVDSNDYNSSMARTPRPPHRRDSLGQPDVASISERPLPRKESLSNSGLSPSPANLSSENINRRREFVPQKQEDNDLKLEKVHRQEHLRRCSSTSEKDLASTSPAHQKSLSSSPGVSVASDPASPVHTEDEKQENEETEKKEVFVFTSDDQGKKYF